MIWRILTISIWLLSVAGGHELLDVQLAGKAAQFYVKMTFSGGKTGEAFPKFFQKSGDGGKSMAISFLETSTSIPLGSYPLAPSSPLVEEVRLKKLISPSGKNFLSLEIRFAAAGKSFRDLPVSKMGANSLKLILDKRAYGSFDWSLKKTSTIPTVVSETPAAPVPLTSPQAVKQVKVVPKSPADVSAPSGAGDGKVILTLKELKLLVSPGQEELVLLFHPPGTPGFSAERRGPDSSLLRLSLEGVLNGMGSSDFTLAESGLFRKVSFGKKADKAWLDIRLSGKQPIHILPGEGFLSLTGSVIGSAAQPFKWSSHDPKSPGARGAAVAEPVQGAHLEGAELDAKAVRAGEGVALTSSKVFSPGKHGKPMILLKDSIPLKEKPGKGAQAGKKLPAGAQVKGIGFQNGWARVVAESGDTGYIAASQVVFEDEITALQEERIRKILALKQVRQAEAVKRAQSAAERQNSEPVVELSRGAETAAAEKAAADLMKREAAAKAKMAEEHRLVKEAERKKQEESLAQETARLARERETALKLAGEKDGEKLRVVYNSYGRRDPFIPVEEGMSEDGIDIDKMKVVGIVWQTQEPMAVLEHTSETGVSYTVRQGDPVHNGRVSRITKDAVTFELTEFGISRSYSLRLISSRERQKR